MGSHRDHAASWPALCARLAHGLHTAIPTRWSIPTLTLCGFVAHGAIGEALPALSESDGLPVWMVRRRCSTAQSTCDGGADQLRRRRSASQWQACCPNELGLMVVCPCALPQKLSVCPCCFVRCFACSPSALSSTVFLAFSAARSILRHRAACVAGVRGRSAPSGPRSARAPPGC